MDVAAGAAYCGRRALVTTKQVGMNVLSDSLFYTSYTGAEAAIVVDESMNGNASKIKDCVCPQSMGDLSSCLKKCLKDMNCNLRQKFTKIKVALLVDGVLKVEDRTLTPSMKLAPNNVKEVYKAHIDSMYNKGNVPDELIGKDVYLIYIEE